MHLLRASCRTLAVMALLCGAMSSGLRAQSTNGDAPPALRLAIQYSDGEFNLLSQRSLLKVLAPSDRLPAVEGHTPAAPENWSGFWYELVGADGSVLYRRIVENPILRTFEGPDPNDTEKKPVRHESLPAQRVFSILTPDVPANFRPAFVVFFSSPLRPGAQAEPASEVGRVELYGEQQPPIN